MWARVAALSLRRAGRADRGDAPRSWSRRSAGSARAASCTRSTTACCCPAPRRSSSPPISAGCCTDRAAASSPARCSCCRASSPSWRSASLYALLPADARWCRRLFFGLKAAVLAIVVEAVHPHRQARAEEPRAWSRSPRWPSSRIFFFDVPFPLIVLGAGAHRLSSAARSRPDVFAAAAAMRSRRDDQAVDAAARRRAARRTPAVGRARCAVAGGLAARCGWRRSSLIVWRSGADSVFTEIGVFFSKMAVVTFGGAYAVLAYVAQEAVETLSAGCSRARCSTASAWPRRRPGR